MSSPLLPMWTISISIPSPTLISDTRFSFYVAVSRVEGATMPGEGLGDQGLIGRADPLPGGHLTLQYAWINTPGPVAQLLILAWIWDKLHWCNRPFYKPSVPVWIKQADFQFISLTMFRIWQALLGRPKFIFNEAPRRPPPVTPMHI